MHKQSTFKNYLCRNRKTISIIGLFTLVFCILRLVFPTISYDTDEWLTNPQNTLTHWLGIGRYSLVFLKYCFGTDTSLLTLNIVTYVNVFIYTILFLYFLNIDHENFSSKKEFLCGTVLITSPIFLEQYYFTLQSAEVSFAMILIMLSYITTYKLLKTDSKPAKKFLYSIVTFVLLVFSFGMYQAFVNLYVIGVLICLYKLNAETKAMNFKNIGISVLIFLLSLISYSAVSEFTISHFNIVKDGYLGIEWFNGEFVRTLKDLIVTIGRILLGHGNILNLSYTFCLIYIICKIIKAKNYLCWKNFYLLALLASPFLLNILTGTNFVIRSILGFPILCAFIFHEFFDDGKLLRLALYMTVLSQFIHSELLLYSDYIRNKNDVFIVQKVYEDCNADENTIIVFKGIQYAENNSFSFQGQVMGHSFFEWCTDADPENAEWTRILYFMQSQGLYTAWSSAEQLNLRNSLDFPDEYPNDGYIIEQDGVYYVNLGVSK